MKFQEKISINGQTLYRSNEPRDLNTQEWYWEYEFYSKWDKKKNILPKPSHIVKVYTSFAKKIDNGQEFLEVKDYLKGILKDLRSNTEEKITSISQEKCQHISCIHD